MHPEDSKFEKLFVSGDEAVALAALDANVKLGTGYPGTPSTEILETFEKLGGRAQWAPNEKVALEVGIGAAFAGARALVTMKHVGLNVAADALFTVAYTGVDGALIVVSADDPGMASSQNEQDNRRYAVAAGVPMLEPSDSQEAYDFILLAIETSERWHIPVLFRMTTRVCHSKSVVQRGAAVPAARPAHFAHDIRSRVMIPAYAVRRTGDFVKLAQIAEWNEESGPNMLTPGSAELGMITSGICYQHVREAEPAASVLKLGMTYPLPTELMRKFASSVERCLVIEEGDPYLVESARMAGIAVEDKSAMYRFGELNVPRVRRIVAQDSRLRRSQFRASHLSYAPDVRTVLCLSRSRTFDCYVAGDIGCYSLGVLPPFEAMDVAGLHGGGHWRWSRYASRAPPDEAKRVVSVLGDSTFVHSGITGLVEMIYNPPPTGHVLLILDNGTTAMTGLQEHPGTGRTLEHSSTGKVIFEIWCEPLACRTLSWLIPLPIPKLLRSWCRAL